MKPTELKSSLAKAIRIGISQYQAAIVKNDAKEKNGLAKLSKALGQQDSSFAGAETPNLTMAEKRPGENPKFLRPFVSKQTGKEAQGVSPAFVRRGEAAKNNKRAEYEASKVEKSEFDGDDGEGCGTCGGPVNILGTLGNRTHSVCRNCGTMTSREENVAAKETSDPTVSKGELHSPASTPKGRGFTMDVGPVKTGVVGQSGPKGFSLDTKAPENNVAPVRK